MEKGGEWKRAREWEGGGGNKKGVQKKNGKQDCPDFRLVPNSMPLPRQ